MPEELVVIALLSILCGTAVIVAVSKMIVNYLRDKSAAASGAGASLTESQLRQLVQEAVEEAVGPLVARIEAQERDGRLLLDDMDAEERAELMAAEPERERLGSASRQR